MKPQIFIVGLGPGDNKLITQKAWQVLKETDVVYVRTLQHPIISDLPRDVKSFDYIYDQSKTFADVYTRIAIEIINLAKQGTIVYGVPGHPMVGEATVKQILAKAKLAEIPVKIIDGLSFVEPTLRLLSIDGLDGVQLFDALELLDYEYPPIYFDIPILLAQVYSKHLASDVKLNLMKAYPYNHQVALVHSAGASNEKVEWLPLYEIDRSLNINHLTCLFVPPLPQLSTLAALANTVAILRGPNGCPWDQEQTSQSLRSGLLEEASEVLEAIDKQDEILLQEELGDLLFHIVMQCQIASEEEAFNLGDVIASINTKLKRRHPHVWGDVQVKDSADVLRNWEVLKAQEKEKSSTSDSILAKLPPSLPALTQSQKIQNKVKEVGFDWSSIEGVWNKLEEEILELKNSHTSTERHEEIGDILFVVTNLAKWFHIDAELALRDANQRFSERFQQVEMLARMQQLDLVNTSEEQMLQWWHEAKKRVRGNS